MKTINFELSKRLNDLWLLDNIETEYCYNIDWDLLSWFYAKKEYNQIVYKTLTLEEAIDFLPTYILKHKRAKKYFQIYRNKDWYNIWYEFIHWEFSKKTLLEAIEKMIEYLLDNNLLWKI